MLKQCFYILIFVCALTTTAHASIIISPGDTVFLGEGGLDISRAVPNPYQAVASFASGTRLDAQPESIVLLSQKTGQYILNSQYRTGSWYCWNTQTDTVGPLAFIVAEPFVTLRIKDKTAGTDVTNGDLASGNLGDFQISTNLWPVTKRSGYNAATDGFIDILLQSPLGATYVSVATPDGEKSLTSLSPSVDPWLWGDQTGGWKTTGYESGTYTASISLDLNSMQDNLSYDVYNAIKNPVTVTLGKYFVSADTTQSTLKGTDASSVTLHGRPNSEMYIYIGNAKGMSGEYGDQPPMFIASQEGVRFDHEGGPYTIGETRIENGQTIRELVPAQPSDGIYYYAAVTTDASGERTVMMRSTGATKAKDYKVVVMG
jgi:hypothetical protein